jgi:MerR family transcriptional regulator, light-induced transcriptional regulator
MSAGTPQPRFEATPPAAEYAAAVQRKSNTDGGARYRISQVAADMPAAAREPLANPLPKGAVTTFMDAVRQRDEGPSRKLIANLLSEGHTASTLLMELITPAAREFGRMWEDDTCDFFQVTLASGRLQALIHELRDHMARTDVGGGRAVLLCGLPGEDHTLGLSILAEFFTLHGWSVTVGPPFLDADPAELAAQEWYDVIGFSVARDEAVLSLKHFVSRTRKKSLNRSVTIMVGGRAIDADPSVISLVGADAGGIGAVEAVRSVSSLQNREKE